MEESPLLKALRLVEQSRKERAKKISDMLAELPDDLTGMNWKVVKR